MRVQWAGGCVWVCGCVGVRGGRAGFRTRMCQTHEDLSLSHSLPERCWNRYLWGGGRSGGSLRPPSLSLPPSFPLSLSQIPSRVSSLSCYLLNKVSMIKKSRVSLASNFFNYSTSVKRNKKFSVSYQRLVKHFAH